jgi:hypothetical protein
MCPSVSLHTWSSSIPRFQYPTPNISVAAKYDKTNGLYRSCSPQTCMLHLIISARWERQYSIENGDEEKHGEDHKFVVVLSRATTRNWSSEVHYCCRSAAGGNHHISAPIRSRRMRPGHYALQRGATDDSMERWPRVGERRRGKKGIVKLLTGKTNSLHLWESRSTHPIRVLEPSIAELGHAAFGTPFSGEWEIEKTKKTGVWNWWRRFLFATDARDSILTFTFYWWCFIFNITKLSQIFAHMSHVHGY